jgi:hypothetical protein
MSKIGGCCTRPTWRLCISVKIEYYGKNEVWVMVRIPWTIELDNKKRG